MSTSTCPHCGAPFNQDEKFCATCGNPLPSPQGAASSSNRFSTLSEKKTSYEYQPLPLYVWIKGTVELDDRMMTVHEPHTLFKVIPLGASDWSAPVQTISGINYHEHFFLGRLIGGVLVGLIGLMLTLDLLNGYFLSGLIGVALALTGISMVLSSRPGVLEFEKSGMRTSIVVPNSQRKILASIKADLEQRTMRNNFVAASAHIAQEYDRRDDARTERIIDAVRR